MNEGRRFETINTFEDCPINDTLALAYLLVNYNKPELTLESDREFCGFVTYSNTPYNPYYNFHITNTPIIHTSCLEIRDKLSEQLDIVESNGDSREKILLGWQRILMERNIDIEKIGILEIVKAIKQYIKDYATGEDLLFVCPTLQPLMCKRAPHK